MKPTALALALSLAATVAGATGEDDVALYRKWCARCHGDAGDGRGPAAASLALNGRRPRDFRTGLFKFKSTPDGTAPTDDDLRATIRDGLAAGAMPYFGDVLSPAEIDRVIGVVRGFAFRTIPPGAPIDLGESPASGEPLRARGKELYAALGCDECHGADGSGGGVASWRLRNADASAAEPTDLTRPWTFRGGSEARAIALRLATGVAGTPMPSYRTAASPADLWAVAWYVRSLARAPSLRAAAVAAARRPPGDGEDLRRRGEYLVKSGTCFLCHVQMKPDGAYDESSFGAGGMPVAIEGIGTLYSRNLTPDTVTGIGSWSADDVRRALREGRSRNGRRLNPLDMPWTILANLTDGDIDAIREYLTSLPPIRNAVPPPDPAPLLDALPRKLVKILRGEQLKVGFRPGNAAAGQRITRAADVTNPRTTTIVLIVSLAVIAACVLSRPHRILTGLAIFVLGTAATVVPLVYTWPPLEWMPFELVRATGSWKKVGRLLNLPPIRPAPAPRAIVDDDLRALAERGRYVATIGTCSLCHTAGPNVIRLYEPFEDMAGGMKVNWKIFGTTYSRNLTADLETGLGAWTPAEIRRAITSGVARGGRLMHWRAMPWDHFSNLSPEDLEALVVYLQSLVPVRSRVPDPEPPRPGDEEAETFWFGYTGELGR